MSGRQRWWVLGLAIIVVVTGVPGPGWAAEPRPGVVTPSLVAPATEPPPLPDLPLAAAQATEPPLSQFFPETGYAVTGDFLAAWSAGGGVAILGLPITDERLEFDPETGHGQTVQWFERARLERPAEGGPPGPVHFTLLGRRLLSGRDIPPPSAMPEEGRFFPETGQRLTGAFRAFWEANGGLAVFGYPITGEAREISADDGQERTVQYFERARFEDHGAPGQPQVRLGRVGREALARPIHLRWEGEEALSHTFTSAYVYVGGALSHDQALFVRGYEPAIGNGIYRARYQARAPRPDTYQFWGHVLTLDGASPLRWRVNGGLWQSIDATQSPIGTVAAGGPYRFAWYRLGQIPLAAGWHTIDLLVSPVPHQPAIAGLDAFLLTTSGAVPPPVTGAEPAQVPPSPLTLHSDLAATAQVWPRLHRGLAQGGEHTDPAYLARVAPRLRALHPTYLRLDHVFDFYDVVQRGRRGAVTFDFSKLDVALDAVLATGAQPFLSLGLTPAVLSPTGAENAPPVNLVLWRDLVYATVRHVNGERKLGVRYWEVWNEPNLTPFWSGTFDDYTRLYKVTAEAVVAADPSARVGGPATSGHEYWVNGLIEYAAATGVRLDFVSWHTYHLRPTMLANQVTLMRRMLARYPRFQNTELIISEWNIRSDFGAGGGFVTDSPQAAAYAVAAIHSLADVGLSQALFFEAVDGKPPPGQTTWGRWGTLTYDGQPKPVYHALMALDRLHDWRVPATSNDPRLGMIATQHEGRLALAVWHLAPEGTGGQVARLTLAHPPAGLTALRRWTVDANHSRLGGELEEVAPLVGAMTADGWTATLTLTPNSVTLLTWEP